MLAWTAFFQMSAAALLLCLAGAASADTLALDLFGREFKLGPDDEDDTMTALSIDGDDLITGYVVHLERIDILNGVPFIVGGTGSGGNICELAPFVISLPQGKPARVDGPIGDCDGISYDVRADAIVFTDSAYPGETQRVWTWTPAEGMRREERVAEAGTGSGWDALREGSASHPADMLRTADVSALMMARVGPKNESLYREHLKGIGSIERQGGMVTSASCRKFDCEDAGQLTVFDLETRTVFVALKPVGGKIMVFPPVKEWPREAREALKTWAEPWS